MGSEPEPDMTHEKCLEAFKSAFGLVESGDNLNLKEA